MNYKNKYLKYKNKYLNLQKIMKGGGRGRDIIMLLRKIIDINDNHGGPPAVKEYLNLYDVPLHRDSCNTSSVEENIENIRTLINMFDKKYSENIEKGIEIFDKFVTGDPYCLDGRVEFLAKFVTIENPFKSESHKILMLGQALAQVILDMCKNLRFKDSLGIYKLHHNKGAVKHFFMEKFVTFQEYVTPKELEDFFNSNIEEFDISEDGILECNGKLKELLKKEEQYQARLEAGREEKAKEEYQARLQVDREAMEEYREFQARIEEIRKEADRKKPLRDSRANSVSDFVHGRVYIYLEKRNGIFGRTLPFVDIQNGVPRFGGDGNINSMSHENYLFFEDVPNVPLPIKKTKKQINVAKNYIINYYEGVLFMAIGSEKNNFSLDHHHFYNPEDIERIGIRLK